MVVPDAPGGRVIIHYHLPPHGDQGRRRSVCGVDCAERAQFSLARLPLVCLQVATVLPCSESWAGGFSMAVQAACASSRLTAPPLPPAIIIAKRPSPRPAQLTGAPPSVAGSISRRLLGGVAYFVVLVLSIARSDVRG